MPNYTPNLNLKKPLTGEYYDVVADHNDAMDKIDINLGAQKINIKYPPTVLITGAKGDGTTDDTAAIQSIVNFAQLNKIPVFIPGGKYKVSSTITIGEGVIIEGVGNVPWTSVEGVEILSIISDLSPTLLINNKSVQIKNISVRGTTGCTGIRTDNSSYDLLFENVKVKNCKIGFDIADSWTFELRKCRTEAGEIGFKINSGTSATFTSCVAFNALYQGFLIDGINYSAFLACGADGCGTAVEFPVTARGLTFVSFGMERIKTVGIKCSGSNVAVTFTGLNVGAHTDLDSIDIIEMTAGNITITDFRLSSLMAPIAPKKIINKNGGSLVLINPDLYGNVGDVQNCYIIGGNLTNRLNREVISTKINTHSGSTGSLTASTGESGVLFTPAANATYIATAMNAGTGAQNCQQIIRTDDSLTNKIVSDMTPKDAVEFFFSGNDVKIRNLSSSVRNYNWSVLRVR